MSVFRVILLLCLGGLVSASGMAEEILYSGPQPGEALPGFEALAVNGPHSGRVHDFVTEYGDAPILLIFAHYIDRNVYGVWWPCDRYAAERSIAGLRTLFVYLAPDRVSGERRMHQVKKSLTLEVPAAVSIDGVEGPGAYGLNRQVGVTAIIAKDKRVVANITLVQPGLVDAPRIIAEAAKLVGGHVPTGKELADHGPRYRMKSAVRTPYEGPFSESRSGFIQESEDVPDFVTQVQPKMVKAGCFSGGCHGAAAGKGGFSLSLLGYDPEMDYESIVRQYWGRRLNFVRPRESLVLQKPTFQVVHEGGVRFSPDSETYRDLLAWIEAGAPFRSVNPRQITNLEVVPASRTVERPGTEGQLQVLASFSDGKREDVTAYALYMSNDDAVASIDQDGKFTVNAVGETSLTARYMGRFANARVGIPFGGDRETIARQLEGQSSFIDELVGRNLLRLGIEPSELCTDAEFARRAYLDITGTLPTAAEARAFLADDRSDRRGRLVEELLTRPEFAQYWSLWLLDVLRVNGRTIGVENLAVFADWIRMGLEDDRSLGTMVREILTAVGDGTEVAAANFLRRETDPKLQMELTTEALMGSRSRCAQCHNHPFDSWTQTQYHQMAAFFVRVTKTEKGIALIDHGEIEHPKTGEIVAPGFPDGKLAKLDGDEDRRTALASWMASPENRYFARSMANRIWERLMGRGVVEPVDFLSASNPPTNPELLDALEAFFKGGEGNEGRPYSVKSLIAEIVRSRAYQRTAAASANNQRDDRFYSRAVARPLDAYAFVDAVSQVTGMPEAFTDLPPATRAIGVPDASVESYLLDVCGRCRREGSCDEANSASGGVRQALHLINGPAINSKISAPGSRLDRLLADNSSPSAIAEEFYYAALSRPPTDDEREFWISEVNRSEGARSVYEDLVWALLNTRQFVFNR